MKRNSKGGIGQKYLGANKSSRAAEYKELTIHISKHLGLYLTSNNNSSCSDMFAIFKSILLLRIFTKRRTL